MTIKGSNMKEPIINFTEILRNGIGERVAKGEKIMPEELDILDDDIIMDANACDSFAAILYSVHQWCKRCDTDKFISLIIDRYYVPVLTSEVIDYKDIMSNLEFDESWDALFLVVCGVWLKICEDLTLDPDFNKIVGLKTRADVKFKLEDPSYIAYTSAIVSYSYLVGQKFYEDNLPELYDPAACNLEEEHAEMLLPFILITIAILTAEFTKLNVIDHDLINKWCKETGLTAASEHADVMHSAKKFFAPRIKERNKKV